MSTKFVDHAHFMKMAIAQAKKGEAAGEVPVGAVLVDAHGSVLAAAHNQVILKSDPTAHAEMRVLRKASRKIQNYRLLSTTLYATVEPCVMCMGAIIHARVARVVFGALDPKWGAAGSLYHFSGDVRLNHHPEIIGGIEEAACRTMMQVFFQSRRK